MNLSAHEVRTNLLFTMSKQNKRQAKKLTTNLYTNDFLSYLRSTPPRDPQDRREPRQSLRDCASGGAGRDRTDDILLAKQALSQ
ncbi:hypothetical protein NKI30_33495, partial [Mesorhizobium opportunistum]|uniref:hypothetical protein n=1 Tax=Mesorhizobium opportunistum TaxID=593909 RepID=UPI00333CAA10